LTESDGDEVKESTELHTSVVSSTITNPTPATSLASPPAGRYLYNMPVYQSDSPLAVPQTLQRVLNFEPTDYVIPPMVWNTSTGLAWNAPSYTGEPSLSPSTPPPSTPDREDDTLLPIPPLQATESDEPGPPSPVPSEPLVLSLKDARDVDLLAITNGFDERIIKQEISSTESDDGDGSIVIGSEESERSGFWYEYIRNKKMGMDLEDSFIDDSAVDSFLDDDGLNGLFRPL
jgi:hypothetical protein